MTDPWQGGVAQLGESLLCKQEVIGSIPFTSTTGETAGFTEADRRNAVSPKGPAGASPDPIRGMKKEIASGRL